MASPHCDFQYIVSHKEHVEKLFTSFWNIAVPQETFWVHLPYFYHWELEGEWKKLTLSVFKA